MPRIHYQWEKQKSLLSINALNTYCISCEATKVGGTPSPFVGRFKFIEDRVGHINLKNQMTFIIITDIYNIIRFRGQGEDSVSNVTVAQAWGPEFESPVPL